jgi:hypothetical protein
MLRHSTRSSELRDPGCVLAPELRDLLRQRMTVVSVGRVARHLGADRLAVALAAAGVPNASTPMIRAHLETRGLP